MSSQPERKKRGDAYRYTSMSFKMAAVIAAGSLGGHYADLGLALKFPVFTLILTLLSVFFAIYIVILETRN